MRQRRQPIAKGDGRPPTDLGRRNQFPCDPIPVSIECLATATLQNYRFATFAHQTARMDRAQAGNSLPFTGPFNYEASAPWTPNVVPQEVPSFYGGSVLGLED